MSKKIQISNVDFCYQNKEIYKNLSYCFSKGRYIIQGENGGGKTTLLNMIYGYLKPDSGQISINSDMKISYLFQDNMLFNNLSVRENIILKCIANRDTEENILEEKLLSYAKRFKLEDKLDKKVSLLSGGEKQRVQLAILSCDKSDVILLDEPIANLDSKNSKEIMDYIFDLEAEIIIVISHQYIKGNTDYTLLELREGKLNEV